MIGKPNRVVVEAAARKTGLPAEDSAVSGERLYRDIALGQNAGIPSAIVLSGETRAEDLAQSPFKPYYVFDDLQAEADWLLAHR